MFSSPMDAFAAEDAEPVKLTLKPHICVLSKAEGYCSDQFEAEWEVANKQQLSLCLYQENKSHALACWENASLGRAKISMSLTQTTAFELRTTRDQTLMAREFFKVIYARKNTRRNPWSFF